MPSNEDGRRRLNRAARHKVRNLMDDLTSLLCEVDDLAGRVGGRMQSMHGRGRPAPNHAAICDALTSASVAINNARTELTNREGDFQTEILTHLVDSNPRAARGRKEEPR